MPRKRNVDHDTPTVASALAMLGITQSKLNLSLKIEPLLRDAGVLLNVWEYLSASDCKDAVKILAVRHRVPDKEHFDLLPFEAFCVAAEVDPRRALEMIMDVLNTRVKLLRASSTLEKLSKGKKRPERSTQASDEPALLPPIEKVIRDVSDRFNENLLGAQSPPASDDEEED